MFQIDWKANPPIRRLGEKRKDQPEREAGADPDRHHDKRFWKRRIDGRRRLVENRHIRKCQLALQLSLFGRPLPGVQLVGAKLDVALQLVEPVALRLNFDQRLLRLLLARPQATRSGFAPGRCDLSDARAFSRSRRQSACEASRYSPVGPPSSDCWRRGRPWRPQSRLRQSTASLSNPREFADRDPTDRSTGRSSRWSSGSAGRSARLWRSTTPGDRHVLVGLPIAARRPWAQPYSSWLGRL